MTQNITVEEVANTLKFNIGRNMQQAEKLTGKVTRCFPDPCDPSLMDGTFLVLLACSAADTAKNNKDSIEPWMMRDAYASIFKEIFDMQFATETASKQ